MKYVRVVYALSAFCLYLAMRYIIFVVLVYFMTDLSHPGNLSITMEWQIQLNGLAYWLHRTE